MNLSGSMPVPVFDVDQMSLSFYAGAAGITYVVETSTRLAKLEHDRVTLSGPDANQILTATVNLDGQAASCAWW